METPDCVDWKRLEDAIVRACATAKEKDYPFIIVEGSLLFALEPIVKLRFS